MRLIEDLFSWMWQLECLPIFRHFDFVKEVVEVCGVGDKDVGVDVETGDFFWIVIQRYLYPLFSILSLLS